MVTGETCQMIRPHHPDCTCELCFDCRDEECTAPAVGVTTDGRVRVCAECAVGIEREGFTVEYDPALWNSREAAKEKP